MPIAASDTNTTPDSVSNGKTERLALPLEPSDQFTAFMGTWENGVLNGKNFMKLHVTDGMILKTYYDSRNILTVGCGHKVVPADGLGPGDTISLDRAKKMLKHDIANAIDAVNTKIKVPLYQYEFDALVDIAFNCGAYKGFDKMADYVNTHDYKLVPKFIKTYKNGHGNTGRRESEARLFEKGIYDASH